MPMISVVTPCYNEELNVELVYQEVKKVFSTLPHYDYEHVFIDNASKDQTVFILKRLAANDRRVKVIVNVRNFGHIRSPYYGLLQTSGDAVILLVCDLQDPPAMILDFLKKWEAGYKVVLGIKEESEENGIVFLIRRIYYRTVAKIADIQLVQNNTGFGLYDRQVIETLRTLEDPYPYFRGLISELGFEAAKLSYRQPKRKRGITSQNFWTLYDIAMLGVTSHSKIPLRIATMIGFSTSILGFVAAFAYLIAKLIFWNKFMIGTAPILIGVFLFSSVQLFFVGILGEYIGAIYTQVLKRPLVVEKERIGFTSDKKRTNDEAIHRVGVQIHE